MLDLTSMTEESQGALAFLLLLPVGVLITAVFKGILGFRTIGIFTPTILALNQVRSDCRVGIIIFLVTFILGSAGRKLLVHSKLTTITRRGIIATVTVAVFAVMIVISEKMQLGIKAQSVILPVAILTLIIDRFFNIIQKEGNRIAFIILANTILVTLCCFLVFAYTPAEKIFLSHPWLELVVLCGLIYFGEQFGKPFFTFPAKMNKTNREKDNDEC